MTDIQKIIAELLEDGWIVVGQTDRTVTLYDPYRRCADWKETDWHRIFISKGWYVRSGFEIGPNRVKNYFIETGDLPE